MLILLQRPPLVLVPTLGAEDALDSVKAIAGGTGQKAFVLHMTEMPAALPPVRTFPTDVVVAGMHVVAGRERETGASICRDERRSYHILLLMVIFIKRKQVETFITEFRVIHLLPKTTYLCFLYSISSEYISS